jgi:hypothetical protein
MRVFKDTKIATNRGLVDAWSIAREVNGSLRGSTFNAENNTVENTVVFEKCEKSGVSQEYYDAFLMKIESGTGDNIIVPPNTRIMLSDGSSKLAADINTKDMFRLCLYNSNSGNFENRITNCMNIQRMPRMVDKYTFDPHEIHKQIENEVYEYKLNKDSKNFIANGFIIVPAPITVKN